MFHSTKGLQIQEREAIPHKGGFREGGGGGGEGGGEAPPPRV